MAPRKRASTLYRNAVQRYVALPGDILAVAGVFPLIQRVSDILNGIIAKKDAIR